MDKNCKPWTSIGKRRCLFGGEHTTLLFIVIIVIIYIHPSLRSIDDTIPVHSKEIRRSERLLCILTVESDVPGVVNK
jgi:hypothetical protein